MRYWSASGNEITVLQHFRKWDRCTTFLASYFCMPVLFPEAYSHFRHDCWSIRVVPWCQNFGVYYFMQAVTEIKSQCYNVFPPIKLLILVLSSITFFLPQQSFLFPCRFFGHLILYAAILCISGKVFRTQCEPAGIWEHYKLSLIHFSEESINFSL